MGVNLPRFFTTKPKDANTGVVQVQIWSILIGLTLALANGAVSLVVLHSSRGLPGMRFMGRVLGSVGLRMLATFLLAVVVLLFARVDALFFGAAFVAGVVVSLVLEMWFLLRWSG
jgi:hypothetical protein